MSASASRRDNTDRSLARSASGGLDIWRGGHASEVSASKPKGPYESAKGFNHISANLSKASAGDCILSRRDTLIVARHEVPG